MANLPVPSHLAVACRRDGRARWLEGLAAEVQETANHWSLTLGDPFEPGGVTAWVAPARSPEFGDVVLKVGWRHMEAHDEAAGLREWRGEGAVRVHADAQLSSTTHAILLERCTPGTTLAEQPEDEQDVVIASLLSRLWRAPADVASFRPLQSLCEYWAESFERKVANGRVQVEPRLAQHGADLFRALPTSANEERLLCTDLHAQNVLASRREPWLVIDPKPFAGDPTYDALQHLINCEDRLTADPVGLASRMAGLLGLDVDRLVRWLFAFCVVQSVDFPWALDVARRIRP